MSDGQLLLIVDMDLRCELLKIPPLPSDLIVPAHFLFNDSGLWRVLEYVAEAESSPKALVLAEEFGAAVGPTCNAAALEAARDDDDVLIYHELQRSADRPEQDYEIKI